MDINALAEMGKKFSESDMAKGLLKSASASASSVSQDTGNNAKDKRQLIKEFKEFLERVITTDINSNDIHKIIKTEFNSYIKSIQTDVNSMVHDANKEFIQQQFKNISSEFAMKLFEEYMQTDTIFEKRVKTALQSSNSADEFIKTIESKVESKEKIGGRRHRVTRRRRKNNI
jgi:predicted transcriptional regulator